ncbi:MAG: SDR family oxidoreductase [Candidatus Pacearchaeota archaeon]
MKAKILVTGGAGFIGSHITEKLVALGYDVVVIDNLSTGNIKNLEHIVDNIKFIEGDILDLELIKKISKVDYIFHEAALPSVQRSIKDPKTTIEVNVNGTLNVLLAARDNKVKKVIFASSSSIYGDRNGKCKKEIMKPMPLSPYAISKVTGEYLCKVFSHVYGLPTVCLRYFNVFGPRQNPDSEYSAVIPKFIKLILQNKQPTIFGDGKQSRDFTYIDNVVYANILAMKSKMKNGETINIACGESHNLLKLIELINKILDKNIRPIFTEARPGEVKHSLADISKAKKLLGYKPLINFEEGLRRTINFYKKHLSF